MNHNLSHFARRLRDWLILLAGAGGLALVLAALNWLLFVRAPAPQEAPMETGTTSFSREKLDAVLADFERRRLEYEHAPTTFSQIADPGK